MRTTSVFLAILLFSSPAFSHTFVFKSGKQIEGRIRYESESTIRIQDSTGVEITLKKNSLNFEAMQLVNIVPQPVSELQDLQVITERVERLTTPRLRNVKVYTNRDVSVPPRQSDPQSETSSQKGITKLEQEFSRLQSACRGAGTGPNLSKILRTDTYIVNGNEVKVTGYWADPENIEEAKRICRQAINAQKALEQARKARELSQSTSLKLK